MEEDKYYRKLYSIKNLQLTWNRIKTSQYLWYKNYYRHLYLPYDLFCYENLKILSERLKGKSYEPKEPLIIFLPQKSGLRREIIFIYNKKKIKGGKYDTKNY